RLGRALERGAPALAHVAVERELRHHQHGAADVANVARHTSAVVREHAQASELFTHPLGVAVRVVLAGAEIDEQPRADPADGLAGDDDVRGADALSHGPHGPGTLTRRAGPSAVCRAPLPRWPRS